MIRKTYTLDGLGRPLGQGVGAPILTQDAVSGGMAFLVGELEKLDPKLREPLTSTTWPRDIPVKNGGGWVENEAAMFATYGISGGSGAAAVGGGVQNDIRNIQANQSKDIYPTHTYQVAMEIKFIDMQKGNIVGRSLEQIYDKGIRLDFDKYMDANVYTGLPEYGTYGVYNNPNVTTVMAANGAGGTSSWISKTPDEILADINQVIVDVWKAAEYDNSAIPNHILIDPQNYAMLVSRKVDPMGSMSILTYLEDNNIAKKKGVSLVIAECRYSEGSGTGGTNRMLVYCNDDQFLELCILVPLARVMTQNNTKSATYDSLYMAHTGHPKLFYYQTIRYVDGI